MKSLKRDVDSETGKGATRSNVSLRCADCLHFKGSAHPAMGKSCTHLGVAPSAIAPGCYTPNVVVLRKIPSASFKQLAILLSTIKPQQARVLMGLFKCAGSLENTGFVFLQKVYFRLGDDFLENYYSGFVLCKGPNRTISIVGESYLSGDASAPLANLIKSSIMTWDAFKEKRDKLIAQGKLLRLKSTKKVVYDDYEPPSLDAPPPEQEAATKPKKRKQFVITDSTRTGK